MRRNTMISAVNNDANRYYERVQAVQFQTERGYPPQFQQDLLNKTSAAFGTNETERMADRKFGSLLSYGRTNTLQQSEFNLLHPDISGGKKAQAFDFVA